MLNQKQHFPFICFEIVNVLLTTDDKKVRLDIFGIIESCTFVFSALNASHFQ